MEQKFIINGEKPLSGSIKVKGAKNAALKVFPLVLMTDEPIEVVNVPDIEDCHRAQEMLAALGHSVKKLGIDKMQIQRQNRTCLNLPAELVNKFRASIMFVGPLLATCGEVYFPHPGGCVIGAGTRPIDMFLDGFDKMGAKLEVLENKYRLTAKKLKGANIF
ncbi:MAG: UDP-N-acetylglucosamine 1-carboxyvinyltransferase, partial [Patescibacteria group bacterium]